MRSPDRFQPMEGVVLGKGEGGINGILEAGR